MYTKITSFLTESGTKRVFVLKGRTLYIGTVYKYNPSSWVKYPLEIKNNYDLWATIGLQAIGSGECMPL